MNAWQPLLVGSEADQVRETVDHLATVIAGGSLTNPTDASLGTGWAGNAILFNELGCAGFGSQWRAAAVDALARAFQALESSYHRPMLYHGVAGVAWAADRLREGICAEEFPEDDDVNTDADAHLLDLLSASSWTNTYDLVSGLAGYGVYALGRGDSVTGHALVERVVFHLVQLLASRPGSEVWFTPPDLVPDWQLDICPSGYYNLGMAHGIPGVIAVLAQAAARDPTLHGLRAIIANATTWLRHQECAFETGPWFPCWRGPRVADAPSKIAWCYGDLGPASALMMAGQLLNEADWVSEGTAIALRSIPRARSDHTLRDAGLCHGWAGLAHMYSRFAHATGDARFADAAIESVRRTLAFARDHPGGATGYPRLFLDEQKGRRWEETSGFLEGASGIALALAGCVATTAPRWDAVMALNFPCGETVEA